MYETETIDYQEGYLCVKYSAPDFDKPQLVTCWYPFEFNISETDTRRILKLGTPVKPEGNGLYVIESNRGGIRMVLVRGGQTRPIKVERSDIPPPCANGKELRWKSCRWEKYLKTKGWIPA